jgi:membrane protease YdiL (CAAX protease family)
MVPGMGNRRHLVVYNEGKSRRIGPVRTPSPTSRRSPVPWTPRDVWLSVAYVALLYSLAVVLLLCMPQLRQYPGAVLIGLELLMVVPVGYVAFWKYHVGWETLGFRPCSAKALWGGGRVLLWCYAWNAVTRLVLALVHVHQPAPGLWLLKHASPWLVMLVGSGLGPVLEEVFFRSFIFAGLRQRYSLPTAAGMSATLFALMHLQWTLFIPLVVLGFLLAALYERSNSLWPPIVTHVMLNAVALGFAYVRLRAGLPR